MKTFPSYIRDTRAPKRLPPLLSCDSQVHVYGDLERYPVRPGTAYYPPDATFDDVLNMHRTLGIARGLIVQATCYGTDHRLVVEALARGNGQYRGCAIIDDSVSDAELERLHAAGVRGARFNFAKVLKISITPESFRRSIARISELGWFAKIFALGGELVEHKELFDTLTIPTVIDHMGGLHFAEGVDQPGMRMMREYLTRGNWWVMVSSGDRHALAGYPWDEAVPFAQALIETAPDRIVWGTDWPHVIYESEMPNDGDLVDLLYRYAPDEAVLKKILVDNPARIFQFSD